MKVIHVPTKRLFKRIKNSASNDIRLYREDIVDEESIPQTVDVEPNTFRKLILKGIYITEQGDYT